jgi:hypothetical protein
MTLRAKSADANRAAINLISSWTTWAVAIAPAVILLSNMTETGGVTGFILAGCMIVAVVFLILGERQEYAFKLKQANEATDQLAAKITEAEAAISQLNNELALAHAILEGNAPPAKRSHIPQRTRQHIIKRCRHVCSFCAKQGTPMLDPDGAAWHIEHVIPVNRGGPTRADNLTLACSSCNLRKGTMPAYAFIQKLIREGERKV